MRASLVSKSGIIVRSSAAQSDYSKATRTPPPPFESSILLVFFDKSNVERQQKLAPATQPTCVTRGPAGGRLSANL